MKEGLLVHGLHGSRNITVAILKRCVGRSAWSEQVFQFGREQIGKFGAAARPLIRDLLPMVAKVAKIQPIEPSGWSLTI